MSIKRNRIEYGCIMDENTFKQMAEKIKCDVFETIDFKNGIVQEIGEDKFNNGIILDIRWKKDIHFILYINRWSGKCLYYVLRNGEQVSNCYYAKKNDEKFLHSIQHLVNVMW